MARPGLGDGRPRAASWWPPGRAADPRPARVRGSDRGRLTSSRSQPGADASGWASGVRSRDRGRPSPRATTMKPPSTSARRCGRRRGRGPGRARSRSERRAGGCHHGRSVRAASAAVGIPGHLAIGGPRRDGPPRCRRRRTPRRRRHRCSARARAATTGRSAPVSCGVALPAAVQGPLVTRDDGEDSPAEACVEPGPVLGCHGTSGRSCRGRRQPFLAADDPDRPRGHSCWRYTSIAHHPAQRQARRRPRPPPRGSCAGDHHPPAISRGYSLSSWFGSTTFERCASIASWARADGVGHVVLGDPGGRGPGPLRLDRELGRADGVGHVVLGDPGGRGPGGGVVRRRARGHPDSKADGDDPDDDAGHEQCGRHCRHMWSDGRWKVPLT